jgi:lysophospholipase L1-like esterase
MSLVSRREAARIAAGFLLSPFLLDACGGGGGSTGSSASSNSSSTSASFDFGNNDARRASAFGDSITFGFLEQRMRGVAPSLVTSNNYPNNLQSMLRGVDPAWRVVNRGVGGEESNLGVGRLPSILAIDRPGFVLIMEGSNDASDDISPRTIVNNLEAMVLQTKGNKSIPILATIPPNFRNDPTAHDIINSANNLIRDLVRQHQITLAEIFNGMNRRELWGQAPDRDPLHPNEQGYQVMAGIWFDTMKRAAPGGSLAAPPPPAPVPDPTAAPPPASSTAGQARKAAPGPAKKK